MIVEFIGGPWDGETRRMRHPLEPSFRIPLASAHTNVHEGDAIPSTVEIRIGQYELRTWSDMGGARKQNIYRWLGE